LWPAAIRGLSFATKRVERVGKVRLTRGNNDVQDDSAVASAVEELGRMPWALVSPARGSVYDALLHEVSLLEEEDRIAAGTLKIAESQKETETAARVLLVPASSSLWARMRRQREQLRASAPGSAALCGGYDADLEARLAGPLQEGEMFVVRLQ
jgi:hypothetical protein